MEYSMTEIVDEISDILDRSEGHAIAEIYLLLTGRTIEYLGDEQFELRNTGE